MLSQKAVWHNESRNHGVGVEWGAATTSGGWGATIRGGWGAARTIPPQKEDGQRELPDAMYFCTWRLVTLAYTRDDVFPLHPRTPLWRTDGK